MPAVRTVATTLVLRSGVPSVVFSRFYRLAFLAGLVASVLMRVFHGNQLKKCRSPGNVSGDRRVTTGLVVLVVGGLFGLGGGGALGYGERKVGGVDFAFCLKLRPGAVDARLLKSGVQV